MKNNQINKMNKEIKFESVMLDVVRQICVKMNKPFFSYSDLLILNEEDSYLIKNFDGIAKQGILDNEPTVVEVKYNVNMYFIKKYISQRINEKKYSKKYKILLICPLNEEQTSELYNIIDLHRANIEIWNEIQIRKKLSDYPMDVLTLKYFNVKVNSEKLNEKVDFKTFKLKNETYKKELRNVIKSKGVTLVLGTGVSLQFKAKSWDELVDELYDNLPSEMLFSSKDGCLKKIGGNNLCIAEYAKQYISSRKYSLILYNSLYENYSSVKVKGNFSLKEVVNLINKKDKVKKVITYNYDNFLEILLDKKDIKYDLLVSNEDYLTGSIPIYHVHGYLPYGCINKEVYTKNIVLTENDYYKLYDNYMNWQVSIQLESFKDDVCLFVGNSITDLYEKKLLNHTKQNSKYHFAIFCKGDFKIEDLSRISAYFKVNCNVNIIWVDNISDISGFLRTL